jgi:acetylornithine deacetylase/succinyl-diaminopimelate desuccinylase-like protein
MAALELPQQPLTTLSVTRAGGGLSINSIPASAWWEVDIRSEDATSLSAREKDARDRAREAVQSENERRRAGTQPLGLEITVIGDRPAGATAADTPLVRAAVMATEMLGSIPELIASSTDANMPMALGIPAITLGAGGSAGRIHTRAEWYENDGGARGIERILLTILAAAHASPSR